MADNYLEKKFEDMRARQDAARAKAERARQRAWKKRMEAYRKKLEQQKGMPQTTSPPIIFASSRIPI